MSVSCGRLETEMVIRGESSAEALFGAIAERRQDCKVRGARTCAKISRKKGCKEMASSAKG